MGISLRLLGHASFQIKASGKIIYVDLKKYGKVVEPSEKADIVLVTHGHADHCSPDKIMKVQKEDTVIIAPDNCSKRFKGDVRSLKPEEETTIDGIKIRAVEAYNHKRFKPSGKPWHPQGYGVGYLIKVEDKTIYHAGDTDLIPEMKKLESVDVALLPTGDKYTMDNAEAAEAALLIKPKVAIPMHTWEKDPKEFKERVETNSDTKVAVLELVEEFSIK
ncbi:MAG: MBL fold metallo-hydrolase [Nitrosopumilus sp.]|nr:MBL fold metallo-hydrolase [Candidatus Bathyarchaeota archaeon]MDH5665728.1 MBL fold metallo-hydrolase [Nitrosopumilus sp.]